MQRMMTRWGVGPSILAGALGYAILAGIATYLWPDICLLRSIPYPVFLTIGILFLVIGVPMWLLAAWSVMRAYNRDTLVTTGVFAVVRHPVYSAWIVFIIPGLTILSRSWLLTLTSVVAYAVFKLVIGKEDKYLEKRFGQACLDYRSRLNELVPFPRLRRK